MLALGFFGWLIVLAIGGVALLVLAVVAASAGGLFAKPVAPKVPEHIRAGQTIRVEDGGSQKLMLLLHPTAYQVSIWRDGHWIIVGESKETKKHRWDWTVPAHYEGVQVRFTATNECPVSDWDSAKSPGTERTVEKA